MKLHDKVPKTKIFDGKRYRFKLVSGSFFTAKRAKEEYIQKGYLARISVYALGTPNGNTVNVVYVRKKGK